MALMTYSKSIIQEDTDYCYICGRFGTEIHHVFGASNRKWSTKYGLIVGLCYNHHRGNNGVHFNRELDLMLKRKAQELFIEQHSESEYFAIFGKFY